MSKLTEIDARIFAAEGLLVASRGLLIHKFESLIEKYGIIWKEKELLQLDMLPENTKLQIGKNQTIQYYSKDGKSYIEVDAAKLGCIHLSSINVYDEAFTWRNLNMIEFLIQVVDRLEILLHERIEAIECSAKQVIEYLTKQSGV